MKPLQGSVPYEVTTPLFLERLRRVLGLVTRGHPIPFTLSPNVSPVFDITQEARSSRIELDTGTLAAGSNDFSFTPVPGDLIQSFGIFNSGAALVKQVNAREVRGASTLDYTLKDTREAAAATTWLIWTHGGDGLSVSDTGTLVARAEGAAGTESYTVQRLLRRRAQ